MENCIGEAFHFALPESAAERSQIRQEFSAKMSMDIYLCVPKLSDSMIISTCIVLAQADETVNSEPCLSSPYLLRCSSGLLISLTAFNLFMDTLSDELADASWLTSELPPSLFCDDVLLMARTGADSSFCSITVENRREQTA